MSFKPLLVASMAAIGSVALGGRAHAIDTASPSLDQSGYALVATFTVKPDGKDEFIQAMTANVAASRREPGVVLYRSYETSTDPLVFVNVELYKDKAAFEDHLSTPHVTTASAVFKQVLAKEIEVKFLDRLP